MPKFDRFDICEAHFVLEVDYHLGGWLPERHSNVRRMSSSQIQLGRMGFTPSPALRERGYAALTDNGKAIYREFVRKHQLEKVA